VRVLKTGFWPRREHPEQDPACVRAALVECRPHTGRRHQIRLHLAAAGIPILGDDTYGGDPYGDKSGTYRMFLHALRLELPLDGDNAESATIEAPCDFAEELSEPTLGEVEGAGT